MGGALALSGCTFLEAELVLESGGGTETVTVSADETTTESVEVG